MFHVRIGEQNMHKHGQSHKFYQSCFETNQGNLRVRLGNVQGTSDVSRCESVMNLLVRRNDAFDRIRKTHTFTNAYNLR